MVVIAGQVAGRRGTGVPNARTAATIGVAVGSGITLGALSALRVLPVEPRAALVTARLAEHALFDHAHRLVTVPEQGRR